MKKIVIVCFLIASMVPTTGAQTDDIRSRVVTLKDGTRIHLLEAGAPDSSPAVVFIPGWTLPASLWSGQIRKFSKNRLVIAIDPRSQGESSKTDVGNTPEQRARDLQETLSLLNVSDVVLVGWSQGANDLAAYIQQFGTASVAGLVFVDSPVSAGPAELELNKEWSQRFFGMISIYENHPAEYVEGMVKSIFRKPHPELDLQQVVAHARKTPVSTGVTMLIMDMFAIDRRPALAKIDRPTLVIASAESPLFEAQKRMAEAIPGAQFVQVPGAGHALFVDEPKIFDDSLQKLLDVASSGKRQ